MTTPDAITFVPAPEFLVKAMEDEIAHLRNQVKTASDNNVYLRAVIAQQQKEFLAEAASLRSQLTSPPPED